MIHIYHFRYTDCRDCTAQTAEIVQHRLQRLLSTDCRDCTAQTAEIVQHRLQRVHSTDCRECTAQTAEIAQHRLHRLHSTDCRDCTAQTEVITGQHRLNETAGYVYMLDGMKTNMNTQAVKPKTNSTEYAVLCVLIIIQAQIFVVAQKQVN